MKTLFLIICSMLIVCDLTAQISLPYEVDFSFGIPSSWTQTSGGALIWDYESFGKEGPGCAIVDFANSSERATHRIELPAMHFTFLSDAVLQFNAAFTRNNFMAPAITVWYDKGNGWEFLDSWGEAGLADLSQPNHLLEGGTDYVPPLDAENIIWHSIIVDLQPFSGEQNIRFAFQAEFPNGGYVLLDDVKFLPMIAGLDEEYADAEVRLTPNPVTTTLSIETDRSFERIKVFDLLGRLILATEENISSSHFDLPELSPGSYWLQLIGSDGTICAQKSFIKE